MATTANYNANTGFLVVTGDALDETVIVSRNAAGTILLNNGVSIQGGTPTVANTAAIQAFGLGGDDAISLNETNGALPNASLFGGTGNDTLQGGSGSDQLFGQGENDTLFGKGGADLLFGGVGNDVLVGGDADDQMFGEAGNDRMIWNPGDDSDVMEGGADADIAEVNGGNGAETFSIAANGSRVRLDRLDPAPFSLDIGTTETIELNANGGNDVITAGNGLSDLTSLALDGGAGSDTILSGDGADVLLGGDGNDVVAGGRGDDVAFLGADADTFVWNPGDGNDVVEGQAGVDTLLFNGANTAETINVFANGGRTTLTRDIAAVTMDLNGVEVIDLKTLGGADKIAIGDLSGTSTTAVVVDLASAASVADGQADQVSVRGTSGADNLALSGLGSLQIDGLAATVRIDHADVGLDALTILAGDGDDRIDASAIASGSLARSLFGEEGNDLFVAGAGSDHIDGGSGVDTADYGASSVGVNVSLASGAGSGGLATGDVLVSVENVIGSALNDLLTGDDKANVLQGGLGADSLTGGDGADLIYGNQGEDMIFGGQGFDTVFGGQGLDLIYGNQGEDLIYGNLGEDTLFGGQGQDTLFGGQGADQIYGNLGEDRLFGNLGDDQLYGGQGNDVLDGGLGSNLLVGGLGADVYVLAPGAGADQINGFSVSDGDRLGLSGQTFTLTNSSDGDVLLLLSGGGTLELNGITQAQFSPGSIA
ncbi:MAG TPA: calcium-binding protein [Beijerinckiaceae bacterium]|jgi:Ca2+-binding RTX toxin-like protein